MVRRSKANVVTRFFGGSSDENKNFRVPPASGEQKKGIPIFKCVLANTLLHLTFFVLFFSEAFAQKVLIMHCSLPLELTTRATTEAYHRGLPLEFNNEAYHWSLPL